MKRAVLLAVLLVPVIAAPGLGQVQQQQPTLSRQRPQLAIPVTSAPSGYGRYCSLTYPNGFWRFGALPDANSDPCGDMLREAPGGTIARAGLWATRAENNVLVRCGGEVILHRMRGGAPMDTAFKQAQGKQGCVFTVAPTTLPIFVLPYGKTTSNQGDPGEDVGIARGFDYNVYRTAMDVTMFGQMPRPGHTAAHSVDREGRQRCHIGTAQECSDRDMQPNCHIVPGEPAYDWTMPEGKPIHAVADGIVRGSRDRDVRAFGCGVRRTDGRIIGTRDQAEIYIEHQVGTGEYAERFVTYYAHMSRRLVQAGQRVTAGQKIGEAGNTGCSGGDHLHFGVFRLTNLSGQRSYTFRTTPDGHGVNGVHGIIDPFGWAAPRHIDPLAWMLLGERRDPFLGTIRDPGAFSINLWKGSAPPSQW